MPVLIERTEDFSDEERYSLQPGKVEYATVSSAGLVRLTLPETEGYFWINEVYECDALLDLTEANITTPAGCAIGYQFEVDGILYYWSGASWDRSDGTYAQSATAAASAAQFANLAIDLSNGSKVRIRVVLHGNGTATPLVQNLVVDYEYKANVPYVPSTCRVHISLADLLGAAYNNTTGKLWVKAERPIAHENGQLLLAGTQEATFDSSGFAEISLPETETVNKKVRFFVSYNDNGSVKQVNFEPCLIPNVASTSILDITTISDDSE